MGRDVKPILTVKGVRIMMKGGKIMEGSIKRILAVLASVFLAISLFSCGGGGGGATTTSTLSGTAATGKPLAYVPVYLKDSKGNIRSTITDANGKFSFDTTDLTPPFYLKTWTYDLDLFSYTDQKSGTANITPLSTAVVAIANNGNADIYTSPPSQLNLSNVNVKDLKNFLNHILQKYGVQNADFITTPFDANGQGMDAVLDSIHMSVDATKKTIEMEIKNLFTGESIGKATISSNGSLGVDDPIEDKEVNNLPQSATSRKYFVYVKDNYGSPGYGPIMMDIVDAGNGKISVTITAVKGDTGGILFIHGNGTKSGNSISFTVDPIIMCYDTNTNENGTGTADFTGTIDSNGNITGTFKNTLLTPGHTCEGSNSNIYEGTFTAEDVTNASPANVAGTYDTYATSDEWTGKDPASATLQIAQNGSSINVSITAINGDTGKHIGQGTVYGNYVVFRVPIILCHDTNPDAKAEYAIFFGKFDSKTNTMLGIYGDGIPSGDSCKAPDNATGFWKAAKK